MFEDIFSIFQYVLALSNLNISTLHIQMDLQSSEIDLNNDFCALDIISKIAFASQELQSTVFCNVFLVLCSDVCSAKVIADIYIDI